MATTTPVSRAEGLGSRLLVAGALTLLVAAVLVVLEVAGPLDVRLRRGAARAVLLAGCAILAWTARRDGRVRLTSTAVAIGLAALGTQLDEPIALALALVGLGAIAPAWSLRRDVGVGLLVVLALDFVRLAIPWPFLWLDGRLAEATGSVGGTGLVASGALGGAYVLVIVLASRSLRRRAKLLAGAAVVALPFLAAVARTALVNDRGESPEGAIVAAQLGSNLALAAVLFAALASAPRIARRAGSPKLPLRVTLAVAAAGLSGLCAIPAWNWTHAEPAEGLRIAFLEEGGLDWDVPTYERTGAFSGGMFGFLPQRLRQAGHATRVVSGGPGLRDELAATDVLVLINTNRDWPEDELGWIGDFVREGGGVLALGDHTDVFGLMNGMNPVLEPYGIRFAFDSAYPIARPGISTLTRTATALFRQDVLASGGPAVAIGASLDVSYPARPIAWSDFAFGDLGERGNVQGSFLGNYWLDEDEAVRQTTVVAAAREGRGRVLAYGDTSSFQNGGLMWSWDAEVAPVLDWLGAGRGSSDRIAIEIAGALLLAALALALVLCSLGAHWTRDPVAAGLWAGLLLAILVPTLQEERRVDPFASAGPGDVVFVRGYGQRTGHYRVEGTFLGPLLTCLQRSGARLLGLDDLEDSDRWRRADAVVLVAPQVALGEDLVEQLVEYGRGGGRLVVISSSRDAVGLEGLLARLGVGLRPVLLRDNVRDSSSVRFVEPSPLDLSNAPGADVLAAIGEEPVIAYVPLEGSTGGALVVADTRFFSSENLEGTWGVHRGNLEFTRALIDEILIGRKRHDG